MHDFVLLRPWWLVTLLLVFIEFLISRFSKKSRWDAICAPHLQPKVVYRVPGASTGAWLIRTLLILSAIAMSGPSFKAVQTPVMLDTSPLMVVLDISLSMKAQDIKPSRLARAKFLIEDLIKKSPNKPIGLVAFAEQAYTIVPVTTDHGALLSLVKALDSELVPIQGSSTGEALEEGIKRLQSSRFGDGQILLITDEVSLTGVAAIKSALEKTNYELTTLMMATPRGAIIPTSSGFVSDSKGQAVMVKLSVEALGPLQAIKNSRVLTWDRFTTVESLFSSDQALHEDDSIQAPLREDAGVYLLLLIVPLSALLFRRGWLVIWLLVPIVSDVHAAPWWKDPNRSGSEAFDKQHYEEASRDFKDDSWRAAALYKNQHYEEALRLYQADLSIEGLYNQGNSMAQLGRYEEARSRYEQVLAKAPSHQDAKYNLELIRDLKDKTPEQPGNSKDKDSNERSSEKNPKDRNEPPSEKESPKDTNKDNDPSGSDKEDKSGQSQDDKQSSVKNDKDNQDPSEKAKDKDAEKSPSESSSLDKEANAPESASSPSAGDLSTQEQQALEQSRQDAAWLDTIEDDPAELLKRKFLYQYQHTQSKNKERSPW